jgi:hypothetical protein
MPDFLKRLYVTVSALGAAFVTVYFTGKIMDPALHAILIVFALGGGFLLIKGYLFRS